MYASGEARILLLKIFETLPPPGMKKPNLIKNDTVHRSLTPKHVLRRWPRVKVAYFHCFLNVAKMLPRTKTR